MFDYHIRYPTTNFLPDSFSKMIKQPDFRFMSGTFDSTDKNSTSLELF